MNSFTESLLPFPIDPNGDLWKITESMDQDCISEIIDTAKATGTIRNPRESVNYNALAIDFGVSPFTTGDIDRYREYLASNVYKNLLSFGKKMTASDSDIQEILRAAGFEGATVITNHHVQPIAPFTDIAPLCFVGSPNAFVGSPTAVVGNSGYELLANGTIYNNRGNPVHPFRRDEGTIFICGGYETDETGLITSVTELEVSRHYKNLFKRLILRTKSVFSMALLVVSYIDTDLIAQTGSEDLPTIAQTGSTTIDTIAQGW
jgi:hypothetical protein